MEEPRQKCKPGLRGEVAEACWEAVRWGCGEAAVHDVNAVAIRNGRKLIYT